MISKSKLKVGWTAYELRGGFGIVNGTGYGYLSDTKRMHLHKPLPNMNNNVNYADDMYMALFGTVRP